MQLHFDRALVERLLDHAEGAARNLARHEEGEVPPALWVVGDDGIYLQSNGEPHLPGEGTLNLVCYAVECDPTKMHHSSWWAIKNQAFGGDDGSEEFLVTDIRRALATYEPDEPLIIEITPTHVALLAYRLVMTRRASPRASRKNRLDGR